ncbi:MAG: hypothetical protein ACRDHW_12330, partial [Ktedonobacteraceae bacterium]
MGQTHRAVEYTYHYMQEYQDNFGLRVNTPDKLNSDERLLAYSPQILVWSTAFLQGVLKKLQGRFQQHRGWLLILDRIVGGVPLQHQGHRLVITHPQAVGMLT